jgi:hypothetical protein
MFQAHSEIEDKTVLEARAKLWQMGIVVWKLDVTQKMLYDFFHKELQKVIVVNASRRLGKSFFLLTLALEQCLKYPKSIVKYIQPETGMIRKNLNPDFEQMLQDCPIEMRPKFHTQDNMWVFPNGSKIHLAGTDNGNYDKLRGGNCLTADTLILTPTGHKRIVDINIGDIVYGYNEDGSTSETKVVNKYYNGKQEVTDIYIKNQYVGACTDGHTWLTSDLQHIMRNPEAYATKELKFSDIDEKKKRIVRSLVDIPCGEVHEKDAYLIGAFLGDGCCTNSRNSLTFASGNDIIPKVIATKMNCNYKVSGNNKYSITSSSEKGKHSKKLTFGYYDSWLKNKNSYQKNFDIDIVNTWDRESCLQLLAGLTDTDGNVHYNKKDNSLEWSYTTVNIGLVLNIQNLVFKLTQFNPSIKVRNHTGNNEYTVRIRNSFFVKKLLKEITPFLGLKYKGYQEWMDTQSSRDTGTFTKITKGNRYVADVFDLEVDNKTHLYLTAHGLVTHNCHLALIDEAGFCTDLKHIINSILIPLTSLTKGRIVLSSTTPPTPDHEFNEYMEYAEKEGTLIRKTILDAVEDHKSELYPRITEEIVADILKAYPGGVENQAFKTEYLCQKIYNSDDSVLPEFTAEVQLDTILDWPRPVFYDQYTAMDIGFVDLTVVLFAYWDYDNGKLVIEDEYVENGPKLTTTTLAEQIKKKEANLWTNKLTREFKPPYKRVSDNNLIVINDLTVDHGLFFQATDKHDKHSYLQLLRTMIENRDVVINPRCKTLIMHMRTASWDKSKKDFKRSADGGHYDALAALLYLSRNIDKTRNPYPNGYRHSQLGTAGNVFIRNKDQSEVNAEYQKLEKMFKRKSSFKSGK